MADKSFQDELERASKRPDVAELTADVDDYYRYVQDVAARAPSPGEYQHDGNFLNVMDAHWGDADCAMAYLALAMSRYDDRHFLGVLAAGLLEDLLRDPSPQVLERIVSEARKTPRFRWMLSGVWLHSIAERARGPVKAVVGDCQLEDPLPSGPF
jgi:Family of unknown function (DUF6869)